MAKYSATQSMAIYNDIETAVAGLETQLEAIDTGKNHLTFDIIKIEANKYATWVAYTAEA
jgi:hypothetical protein